LQFSCHAQSDWKITGFQAFAGFVAAHDALLQSGVAEGPPRLGAFIVQRRTFAAAIPVPTGVTRRRATQSVRRGSLM
jgi:hypothetical protein